MMLSTAKIIQYWWEEESNKSMKHWWNDTNMGKLNYSEKNLFQCHSVCHNFHKYCPKIQTQTSAVREW
jgi:hypothetical protein